MSKKRLALLVTVGVMATSLWGGAAEAWYNTKPYSVSNDSGTEIVNSYGTHSNTKTGEIDYTIKQQAVNGSKYITAGVNQMGTYTEGGKIKLYNVYGEDNVYKGAVKIGTDSYYEYTATYDKETNKWTYETKKYQKSNNGWKKVDNSLGTYIQSVDVPKDFNIATITEKKTNGYFKTDTITTIDSISGEKKQLAETTTQTGDVVSAKVDDKTLTIKVNGETTTFKDTNSTVSKADDNIVVTQTDNQDGSKNYAIGLAKDITVDSVKAKTVKAETVTADAYKVGDKTYISADGINANDQKITKVAAGELSATSTDAVNGSQLYATNQQVEQNTTNINNISNRVDKLGSRVDKVGAGAAALAALHPMDFDPDDKWSFAAGYGNYAGQNAAAIGAFYRPDEKVMFNVGGTVGNGENMVNAGISFALDRTSHVSNSRTAMAREILDMRGKMAEMAAKMERMEAMFGTLDMDKVTVFPDIAENHWAYEYVGRLAAVGIIEGYPDGNFAGDRMMTRYEFAAMLYRAMQNGAQLDGKIVKEFAPELGRIRVDRIHGEDNDKRKIERVRVNGTDKEKNDYRDHYGSKIVKEVKAE